MASKSPVKRFNEKSLNESFDHARDLKFAEDFEVKSSEESTVSKTATILGDFYYTNATASAKALTAKVVDQELKEMRERLQWGTLTPSKVVAKEEFQTQLAKSRFLSLFLVLRRVVGRHQFDQKRKAFKHWVEWLKAYMVLYRSRQNSPQSRSRPTSPNGRSVRFFDGASQDGTSQGHQHIHHHHPHNYHFHGDRNMSPQQMRKELYLHRDIFLSSQDADLEQAVMHHVHAHAANHPEKEYIHKYRSPSRKASHKPDVKHAHAVVPSHIVPKHSAFDGESVSRRSHSPGSTVVTTASTASRTRLSDLSPQQLRKDLHLHHDIFLTSQDDIAEAVLHRAHPHAANHPEMEFRGDSSFSSHSRHHSPSVPSHIVRKHSSAANAGNSNTPATAVSFSSPDNGPAAAALQRNGSLQRSASVGPSQQEHSPQQEVAQEIQSTSAAQTAAQAVPATLPDSQLALLRFASPKRRAALRQEMERKLQEQQQQQQQADAQAPDRARSPSPDRGHAAGAGHPHHHRHHHGEHHASPSHPHASPGRSTSPRVSCRALDTLAGNRKDAHRLHRADPVAHVKNISEGKHHREVETRAISPSLYASGVTGAGLKAFNHTRDKKHAPKPRQSHSPSRHLPEEHAAKVGIQVDPEELRVGSPSRALTRALSILVTPTSDAVKHDHRVSPERSLQRTLTALAATGHDDIVAAVVPPSSASQQDEDEESVYSSDSTYLSCSSDDDEDQYEGGQEGAKQLTSSRLSGLDLTRGLSIRTDGVNNDASTVATSATGTPRRSFTAPTVSHILKLAHRSDSVEKVASKVAKKRQTVKQTLPKSPHPTHTFPIVPEEVAARRAERRTSFRSPTKSHAIKVAAKLGGGDSGSVVSGSPVSTARRRSSADSVASDRDRDDTVRTYIPFSATHGINAVGSANSGVTKLAGSPASASSSGVAAKRLVRRGSTVSSHSPPPPPKMVYVPGVGLRPPPPPHRSATTQPSGDSQGPGGQGRGEPSLASATLDENDDASVNVYNVSDDLDNLFDAATPRIKGTKQAAAAAVPAQTHKPASPLAAKVPAKYKPGTKKFNAYLRKLTKERNGPPLERMVGALESCRGKVGKTRDVKVAFAAWKGAVGWLRRLEERLPQSVLYLLQVEKVGLSLLH
jgi:hypothetical protein